MSNHPDHANEPGYQRQGETHEDAVTEVREHSSGFTRRSQSCGACCFTCTQRTGECTAQLGKKMSPKTIKGAKQCTACSIIMIIFAVGLIVQSFIIPPILHKDLVNGLQKAVLLNDSTTDQWSKWIDNSANPLILTTYVYHIANPDGILAGEVPHLIEMGPYVYRQYTLNFDTQFGSNETYFGPNNTHRVLSFRTYTSYEFAPELSVGTDQANVTTINMPFVSMRGVYEAQDQYLALYDLFSKFSIYKDAPDKIRLFSNKTVHQVLFGWSDPVLELLSKQYRGYIKNYASFNDSLLDQFADNYYSMIYTGGDDTFPIIRNYITWHNQSYITTCPLPYATDMCYLFEEIPAWNNNTNGPPTKESAPGPSAVAILRGNDGSVFPTPINEQSILTTYFSPLIRSIDLEYQRASSYRGVPLLQFGFPATFFSNSQTYPPNSAYFQDGPNGLINLTNVQAMIPLYVSQPRFQSSDPSLLAAVNIDFADSNVISPTIYEVEPESGVTFHVLTSSQVNLYVSPISFPSTISGAEPWFTGMRGGKGLYFPVMWAQEEGGIDAADAKVITEVLGLIQLSQIGGLVIGIFLVVLAMIYFFLSWRAWDLENNKHLHAVRSLLSEGTTGEGSIPGGAIVDDGGSLLDSSILTMQDDRDKYSSRGSPILTPQKNKSGLGSGGGRREGEEVEEIDISYRDLPKNGGSASKHGYQQQG